MKTFLLSALTFGFLFLAGCQAQQAAINTDMNQPLDRRIGVIKSLGGVKTSNKGTHLLQQDDGSTILLKSLMINMDDAQYLNKNVEVRGIVTYTTDQKQIMEVENIDFVEGGASQESSLPQWKEYSSTDLGLSLKYKDDLKMSEKAGEVSFERNVEPKVSDVTTTSQTKPIVHKLLIVKDAFSSNKGLLDELGVKSDSYNDLMAKGMVKSQIGSDNYQAIKKTDGNITSYYIEGADANYEITIDCGQDEQTLSDQNLFYEILGSLKITAGVAAKVNTTEADVYNNETIDTTQEKTEFIKDVPVVDPAAETANKSIIVFPAQQSPETPIVTPVPVTAVTQQTTTTQEAITGYEKMESSSFKFSVQYPKNWFYAGSASADTGVIRHYEFGTKPIEETPGQVAFDLVSGSLPSGTTVTSGTNTIVKTESGGSVELYVKGAGSRIYKLTGPSSMESTLLNIAGSVQEL